MTLNELATKRSEILGSVGGSELKLLRLGNLIEEFVLAQEEGERADPQPEDDPSSISVGGSVKDCQFVTGNGNHSTTMTTSTSNNIKQDLKSKTIIRSK